MSDSIPIEEAEVELTILACEEGDETKTPIEFPSTPPPVDNVPTCLFCLKSKSSPASTPVKQPKKIDDPTTSATADAADAATDATEGNNSENPPVKKIKLEETQEPLIPLPCSCNLNNTLAYTHQSCNDSWLLSNTKDAVCPRCRKELNLTRQQINEIRQRKGLPIEKTVTTHFFLFFYYFFPLEKSHIFSPHSFQYRCVDCSSENISVTFLQSPDTFLYICNDCGDEKVYECYCGCDKFRYSSYTIYCDCQKHSMPNVTYICTDCQRTYNNYEESLFDEFLEKYNEPLCLFMPFVNS